MGSLFSSLKQMTSAPTTEKNTASTMGSAPANTFKHYANAQTEFTKTLPLIGNENAFLGDIFSSSVPPLPHLPTQPHPILQPNPPN